MTLLVEEPVHGIGNKERHSSECENHCGGVRNAEENALDQRQRTPVESGRRDIQNKEQPPPPDGGWGWVVVFASFMIHVVTDGVVYSLGELFEEFLRRFEAGNGATSVIISTLVGTTLCSGPIASAFVNKYGCRAVTIAGSIISTCFILASMYATSILMLDFTIGLGTGLGFGLIYLPAIVCVTCYFEKYRSIATGIAVCGSGFGTVIFAPIFKYLLVNVGIETTFFVIALLVLTCVLYGSLFRPLPTAVDVEEESRINKLIASPESVPLTVVTSPPGDPHNDAATLAIGRRNSIHGNGAVPSLPNSNLVLKKSLAVSQTHLDPKGNAFSSTLSLKSAGSGMMYRKDVFLYGSASNVSRSNRCIYSAQKTLPHSRLKDEDRESLNGSKSCCPGSEDFKNTLKQMMDFSIVRDPVFIVFATSNFLTSIGFNIPYIFIPVQAKDKQMDEKMSGFLLSAVGAGNTLGRIILGYVCDNPKVNRLYVYNTCLTICGIATALSIYCSNVHAFAAFCALYGFTTGAYVGLTSVVTADLLGLDRLTNAFGMILLFQGIASFIGPPIAGGLCDYFNEARDPAFILSGISIALSGLMLYALNPLQSCLQSCCRGSEKKPFCENGISNVAK